MAKVLPLKLLIIGFFCWIVPLFAFCGNPNFDQVSPNPICAGETLLMEISNGDAGNNGNRTIFLNGDTIDGGGGDPGLGLCTWIGNDNIEFDVPLSGFPFGVSFELVII